MSFRKSFSSEKGLRINLKPSASSLNKKPIGLFERFFTRNSAKACEKADDRFDAKTIQNSDQAQKTRFLWDLELELIYTGNVLRQRLDELNRDNLTLQLNECACLLRKRLVESQIFIESLSLDSDTIFAIRDSLDKLTVDNHSFAKWTESLSDTDKIDQTIGQNRFMYLEKSAKSFIDLIKTSLDDNSGEKKKRRSIDNGSLTIINSLNDHSCKSRFNEEDREFIEKLKKLEENNDRAPPIPQLVHANQQSIEEYLTKIENIVRAESEPIYEYSEINNIDQNLRKSRKVENNCIMATSMITNDIPTVDGEVLSSTIDLTPTLDISPLNNLSVNRLTYFTDRYMECNPSAFKNNDACHTLVCALMLLNTDIHGQVSKKRMTCKEFVDNIQSNYPDNDYKETDLISVYSFIRKTELKNEDASDGTNTLRRKFTKLITKSIRPPQEQSSVDIDSNLLNQQHFISGNIMRKCIKRSFGKKPALGHRGWKLQFASLIGLQLLLFKTNLNKNDGRTDQEDFNGDRISLTDSNISSELLQNDDSSLCISIHNTTNSINSKLPSSCSRDNIQVSVDDVESCIKIHHAFASVVEKLRHKNVFSLRLADQAEYFFKVKSDQLQTWVNKINYAAAILSAPPIVGAGQCGLYKPLLPGYITDLDKSQQILNHETQIWHYRESLKKLQMVNSKARAINESNIQFCKYEITRFETYIKHMSSPSLDDLPSDQPPSRLDITSILSSLEPHINTNHSTNSSSPSTRSTVVPHHTPSLAQDMTTLRRRPPKVPIISHTNSISRITQSLSNKLTLTASSPSTDTNDHHNHDGSTSQYSSVHPVSARPVVYSPQIGGVHLPFTVHAGVRPTPSFSRFIDPSSLNNAASNHYQQSSPEILSPLITARSQHSCLSGTMLPDYSPPNSRQNINQV